MTCWNLQRNTRELRWHTSIYRYFSSKHGFIQETRPELKHSINSIVRSEQVVCSRHVTWWFLKLLDLKTKNTRRFFRYMPSKGLCLFLQCQYSMLMHVAHVSMQVFGLKCWISRGCFFGSMSSQTRLIGRICVQCQGKCLILCCTHVGFLVWHPVSWAHVYEKVASRILTKTKNKSYLQATLVTLIILEMSMSVCRFVVLWCIHVYTHILFLWNEPSLTGQLVNIDCGDSSCMSTSTMGQLWAITSVPF